MLLLSCENIALVYYQFSSRSVQAPTFFGCLGDLDVLGIYCLALVCYQVMGHSVKVSIFSGRLRDLLSDLVVA